MIAGQFKRIHLGALAGLGFATLSAAPFALNGLAGLGYSVSQFPAAERLMAMLDARSPGERSKGELAATKVKAKKIAQAGLAKPTQRALGKIVQASPPPSEAFVAALTPGTPALAVVPAFAAPSLAEVVPAVAGPILAGGPGVPAIVGGGPGGGGGGGGGGGVTPPSQETPGEVISAVPEPGTWMTMLLGFGVVGVGMRRRGTPLRTAAKAA